MTPLQAKLKSKKVLEAQDAATAAKDRYESITKTAKDELKVTSLSLSIYLPLFRSLLVCVCIHPCSLHTGALADYNSYNHGSAFVAAATSRMHCKYLSITKYCRPRRTSQVYTYVMLTRCFVLSVV